MADETFKGGILNDLDHAVEVYLSNREADVWQCTHCDVRLPIRSLHKHNTVMF